ncbi:hypothetical protein HDU97_000897 [Phlyctochytrium planicorne]|nr:hypothetical protein HDU97_000885 [Phlyctochytrium planicorne]KAJ3102054.1 hypothetical protein HDU97_000897 [Phlyctochytrium planicorne]
MSTTSSNRPTPQHSRQGSTVNSTNNTSNNPNTTLTLTKLDMLDDEEDTANGATTNEESAKEIPDDQSSYTTSSEGATMKRLSTDDGGSPTAVLANASLLLQKSGTAGGSSASTRKVLEKLATALSTVLEEHRVASTVPSASPAPPSALEEPKEDAKASSATPEFDTNTKSSELAATSTPTSETKDDQLIEDITNTTFHIRDELVKTRQLQQQLREAENRLRARDQYLQNTIMDTARRVQELEQLTADLGSKNEELERELHDLRREKNHLENELVDLEEDHFALQNEIAVTESVGVVGGGAGGPGGALSAQVLSAGVGASMDLGIPDDHNILDDYVLLRDIDTQTDDDLWLHAALTSPAPQNPSRPMSKISTMMQPPPAPPSTATTATMTLENRARSISNSSAASDTLSITSPAVPTTPGGTAIPGSPTANSKQERRLLSLSSKLSYASLIAQTQSETIKELEDLLARREAEVQRLTNMVSELGFRAEHAGTKGESRDRIIEELNRRIQDLESERAGERISKRFGADGERTVPDRPVSMMARSSPVPPMHAIQPHQNHRYSTPPSIISSASSNSNPSPVPPASQQPLNPSTQKLADSLAGLDLYMSTLGSYLPGDEDQYAAAMNPPPSPSHSMASTFSLGRTYGIDGNGQGGPGKNRASLLGRASPIQTSFPHGMPGQGYVPPASPVRTMSTGSGGYNGPIGMPPVYEAGYQPANNTQGAPSIRSVGSSSISPASRMPLPLSPTASAASSSFQPINIQPRSQSPTAMTQHHPAARPNSITFAHRNPTMLASPPPQRPVSMFSQSNPTTPLSPTPPPPPPKGPPPSSPLPRPPQHGLPIDVSPSMARSLSLPGTPTSSYNAALALAAASAMVPPPPPHPAFTQNVNGAKRSSSLYQGGVVRGASGSEEDQVALRYFQQQLPGLMQQQQMQQQQLFMLQQQQHIQQLGGGIGMGGGRGQHQHRQSRG